LDGIEAWPRSHETTYHNPKSNSNPNPNANLTLILKWAWQCGRGITK